MLSRIIKEQIRKKIKIEIYILKHKKESKGLKMKPGVRIYANSSGCIVPIESPRRIL